MSAIKVASRPEGNQGVKSKRLEWGEKAGDSETSLTGPAKRGDEGELAVVVVKIGNSPSLARTGIGIVRPPRRRRLP